jgi:hypothetical protein
MIALRGCSRKAPTSRQLLDDLEWLKRRSQPAAPEAAFAKL